MSAGRQSLKAVFLDWAGTTVDFGSRAPTQVFVEVFRRKGIAITEAEARGPMGRAKPDHIAAIAATPRVAALWVARYGREAQPADLEALYAEFLPLQREVLGQHCDVIPGVPQAIDWLRGRSLKIAASTGYTRELMNVAAPLAARGGYAPDTIVCADDVPAGRPAPWMNFVAAQRLGVYPLSAVLVVDDTPVGIEAGLHAGATTVAITQTGNALGLSEQQLAALPPDELRSRVAAIERDFLSRGAHHALPSVAELPALVQRLFP